MSDGFKNLFYFFNWSEFLLIVKYALFGKAFEIWHLEKRAKCKDIDFVFFWKFFYAKAQLKSVWWLQEFILFFTGANATKLLNMLYLEKCLKLAQEIETGFWEFVEYLALRRRVDQILQRNWWMNYFWLEEEIICLHCKRFGNLLVQKESQNGK